MQQQMRPQQHHCPLPQRAPLLQLQQGRAPRHRAGRLSCYARRTVSGGSDTGTNKGSPIKRPADSSNGKAPRSSKASQVVVKPPATSSQQQQQQQRQQHTNSSRGKQGPQRRQQPNKRSAIEEFMRTTPGLNRLLDGTLILGDAVMVTATELSSERLPLEQLPALGGVAVASWVIAGAILGDYTAEPDPDANPLSDALGWPIFAAVVNAMITWALGMVLSILGFSWLVSNFIVEPEMVLEVARDGMLSPQLEISVALLITMSCWRGMAARLRL